MLTGTNIIRKLQQENARLQSENTALTKQLLSVQNTLLSFVNLQKSFQAINPNTNVFNLINLVLKNAMMAVGSENGSLALLDEKTGDLVFVEVLGQSRDELLNLKLSQDQGIAHWCIQNKLPKLIEDSKLEIVYSPTIKNDSILKSFSIICVPLLYNDHPLGVIEVVDSITGQPFTETDKDVLMVIGSLAAMIITSAEKL